MRRHEGVIGIPEKDGDRSILLAAGENRHFESSENRHFQFN